MRQGTDFTFLVLSVSMLGVLMLTAAPIWCAPPPFWSAPPPSWSAPPGTSLRIYRLGGGALDHHYVSVSHSTLSISPPSTANDNRLGSGGALDVPSASVFQSNQKRRRRLAGDQDLVDGGALQMCCALDRSSVAIVPSALSGFRSTSLDDDQPDFAPIIERRLDFYDFDLQTVDGHPFSLRDYAQGKNLVIVEYFAGWCKNSNRNGHILERLWTKYRQRGLGLVGVAEYSDASELRIHINRIGIDYPVVVETRKLDQRKDSSHYKYRRAVGDKRKWGTPFYVIIDARDIGAAAGKAPFASRVYTVSGEMVEAEVDQFISERASKVKPK